MRQCTQSTLGTEARHSLPQSHEVRGLMRQTFHLDRLRPREGKLLVQGHIARRILRDRSGRVGGGMVLKCAPSGARLPWVQILIL